MTLKQFSLHPAGSDYRRAALGGFEPAARGVLQPSQGVGTEVRQGVTLEPPPRYSTGLSSGAYAGRNSIWMCPSVESTSSRTKRLKRAILSSSEWSEKPGQVKGSA